MAFREIHPSESTPNTAYNEWVLQGNFDKLIYKKQVTTEEKSATIRGLKGNPVKTTPQGEQGQQQQKGQWQGLR